MKIKARSLICLLGLTLLVAGKLIAAPLYFTFNPPMNEKWQVTKITNIEEFGQSTDNKKSSVSFTTEYKVTKSDDFFEIESALLDYAQTKGGLPSKNPIMDAMRKVTIVYHLDSSGRAISSRGYEKVKENLERIVPDKTSTIFSESTLIDDLEIQALQEITSRNDYLVGEEVREGKIIFSLLSTGLPMGQTMDIYCATIMSKPETSGQSTTVELRIIGNSNPYLLASDSTIENFDPVKKFNLTSDQTEDAFSKRIVVEETGCRVLEVGTMRTVAEKSITLINAVAGKDTRLLLQKVQESKIKGYRR